MNMSRQGYFYGIAKGHRLLPMVTLLLALLSSGCTMYAGDHKVIVEDYSQPAFDLSVPQKSGLSSPDKALPNSMYEAGVMHRKPQSVYVCFPRIIGDCT